MKKKQAESLYNLPKETKTKSGFNGSAIEEYIQVLFYKDIYSVNTSRIAFLQKQP
jgi:hypothetical protein